MMGQLGSMEVELLRRTSLMMIQGERNFYRDLHVLMHQMAFLGSDECRGLKIDTQNENHSWQIG